MGFKGFPGGLDGKESACTAGDPGSIPGLRRSLGGGNGTLLQYSSLENPHGQRSLAGHSPRGPKESDATERLTFILSKFSRRLETHSYLLAFSLGRRREWLKSEVAEGEQVTIGLLLCAHGYLT